MRERERGMRVTKKERSGKRNEKDEGGFKRKIADICSLVF